MSQRKRYSITLAVEKPDGNQCFFDLTVENPIGFSSTNQDLFLMRLLHSFAENCPIILKPEAMDSSQYGRLRELESS
jgi:hypothetical protein